MKIIRKLAPHGAILIANMYFILFGIDRVNTAMNFINNGYTKGLLVVMILCFAACAVRLLGCHERRKGDGKELHRLIPMLAGALLCLTVAIILLVDMILGNRDMPFLSEIVKFITLGTCIAAWVNAAMLIAMERADIRAEQARRAAARRNAQRRPAQRPQNRPAPRYNDGYARSAGRTGNDAASRSRSYRCEDEPADRYSASRRSGYAGDEGVRRTGNRSSDNSRYGESRYSGESYSRSRYDGESRARTNRYDDGYSRDSRYAGDSGYTRSTRYTDDGYSRSRYEDGGYDRSANRRSGGYDGEVGGISRSPHRSPEGESSRRSSRYTDEY